MPRTTIALKLSAMAVLLGLILSGHFDDWTWFARSGYVVIAISIWYLFKDFANWADRDVVLTFSEHLSDRAKRLGGEGLLTGADPNELRKAAITARFSPSLQGEARYIEKWLLLVGTMLSGFGDLIGKL